MNEDGKASEPRVLARLDRAIDLWAVPGEVGTLERWLGAELDEEGVPRRLAIAAWTEVLSRLLSAKEIRSGWPRTLDEAVLALIRSLLRFTRLDGTPALAAGSVPARSDVRALLGEIVRLYPRSGEARVAAWMLRRPEPNHAPPPLPAWSSSRRPMAALRENWQKKGDLLVVDQPPKSSVAGLELIGGGIPWLGPAWRLTQAGESATAGKPGCWQTSSTADLFEWSYRAGGLSLTRSVVLLRGRRLALLGEQVGLGKTASPELSLELSVAPDVAARPLEEARGMALGVDGSKLNAQVLPVGLPALPYETERGRFGLEDDGRRLRLTTKPQGRRCWLPVLVSWDPARHRKRLSWRVLTVTQEGRVCTAETAFAVRVSWGRDDTIVIYRSLGPPAHRAFLGHQTDARFLVGSFSDEGVVEPLLTVEA